MFKSIRRMITLGGIALAVSGAGLALSESPAGATEPDVAVTVTCEAGTSVAHFTVVNKENHVVLDNSGNGTYGLFVESFGGMPIGGSRKLTHTVVVTSQETLSLGVQMVFGDGVGARAKIFALAVAPVPHCGETTTTLPATTTTVDDTPDSVATTVAATTTTKPAATTTTVQVGDESATTAPAVMSADTTTTVDDTPDSAVLPRTGSSSTSTETTWAWRFLLIGLGLLSLRGIDRVVAKIRSTR